MDGRDERGQFGGQIRYCVAGEECSERAGVGEAEDQRGVETLILGVVVRHVRRVPELLAPGHEHLCAEFLQYAGTCDCADELIADEFPEGARTDAILFPEVNQGSASGPGTVAVDGDGVVPAGGVWRPCVEQGASEHIDLILVGEFGLLLSKQRREDGPEGDLCDPVDLAIYRDGCLNASNRWPQPRVALGQVYLAILVQAGGRADDLGVRPLPVVHPPLSRLVGTHPQKNRRDEGFLDEWRRHSHGLTVQVCLLSVHRVRNSTATGANFS